ncbi:MAG: SLC13 family permease [Planctomycetota bacterium]
MTIWWLVALSLAVVLVSLLWFRLHAFVTLLVAGLLVASLTPTPALEQHATSQLDAGKMTSSQATAFVDRSAAARLTAEFGNTAGKIGVLIALASIIGALLSESGAAAMIVQRMLALTGPKRAPEALAFSSFLIAIPVYFDTVFYLMVPLARSLRKIVGKNYVLFLSAILAGGSIAHSLVPPTPGPLQVAELLEIDVGVMLIAGLTIGSCSSLLSLAAARVINRMVDVPLRDVGSGGSFTEGIPASKEEASQAAETGQNKSAHNRPSLLASLLPILVPVVLITAASVMRVLIDQDRIANSNVNRLMFWLGEKNIAIGLGLVFGIPLLRYVAKERRTGLTNDALAAAGSIILITAAGGAFGKMLYHAGIADAVSDLVDANVGLMLLPIAFLVTTSIRTLQGSATVAMITAAGVLQGFASAENLPFHPVYLAMAIGAGSKPISWMTDSGFWMITRMSGLTEREGLQAISTMSIALGVSALSVTMVVAWLCPFA